MAFLMHYGTPRHSGRYPWGTSGWGEGPPYDRNPEQRGTSWLGLVKKLRSEGLSDNEIAKGMGMNSSQFRNKISIENAAVRADKVAMATRLDKKGYSHVAIGKRMGINESSVRNLLNPVLHEKSQVIANTVYMLKDQIDKKGIIDVGLGTEAQIGIARTKFNAALSKLKEDGYVLTSVEQEQMGMPGKYTIVKVAAKPGTTTQYINQNRDKIGMITDYTEDSGRSFLGIEPVKSISSDRVQVRFKEEGGGDMDGVIQLRRGVDDLSLGESRYAQVRIAVDDKYFLKGMAVYSDDLPKGVDIIYNSSKSKDVGKIGAMKKMVLDENGNIDVDAPFKEKDKAYGATVRQKHYVDKDGNTQLSALNIVGSRRFTEEGVEIEGGHGEEGAWGGWSKTLSSQMLSKQAPQLAEQQLNILYDQKKQEFDEIMALTNPTVKAKMLNDFAGGADSAAVHLQAAGLPKQAYHVILPMPKIKETEVYAPNYENGERVVLIRHPHGGIFEIPELTVNNKTSAAKELLGPSPDKPLLDAIGIHPKVAQQLSGADFDGDSVIVIPNKQRGTSRIITDEAKQSLIDFDPRTEYAAFEGMTPINPRHKQQLMGQVSNLITDMTIKGADQSEIIRAVKHSMVVIDSEKHNLNYKQSHIDHGIAALKTKYQGGPTAGAATLISKASAEVRVPHRKLDWELTPEGALKWKPSGKTVTKKVVDKKTGEVTWIEEPKMSKSTRMAEVSDAFKLSSGTEMETIYAAHANRMKSLANTARKIASEQPSLEYNPSARKVYAEEVASLEAKLRLTQRNKPRERNAQLLAGSVLKAKRQASPGMDAKEVKKIRNAAIAEMRTRTGAKREVIKVTPREWEAIQAGAVSNNTLSNILKDADLDVIKQYATPRTKYSISDSQLSRAKSLLASGASLAEVSRVLGVPRSTLRDSLTR